MNFYELTLPIGPITSHYYQRGDAQVSEEGQAYRLEVLKAVKQVKLSKLDGRLFMIVRVHPRDKRSADMSSRIRVLKDALQAAGAFDSAEQVEETEVKQGPVVPGGRIDLMIGVINAR